MNGDFFDNVDKFFESFTKPFPFNSMKGSYYTEDDEKTTIYKDGKVHCEEGPAVRYKDGKVEFWWDGRMVSADEHATYKKEKDDNKKVEVWVGKTCYVITTKQLRESGIEDTLKSL